jgi:hypothetical protein
MAVLPRKVNALIEGQWLGSQFDVILGLLSIEIGWW